MFTNLSIFIRFVFLHAFKTEAYLNAALICENQMDIKKTIAFKHSALVIFGNDIVKYSVVCTI